MSTVDNTDPHTIDLPEEQDIPSDARHWPRYARLAGYILGVGMLAAVIVVVVQQREVIGEAVDRIDVISWEAGLLSLSVVANIILTGVMFSILKSRYGHVGIFEMQLLIAAATMLNFLPLRPGLIGRIAYHKKIHDIRVRDSMKVLLQASVISIALAGYFALAIGVKTLASAPLLLTTSAVVPVIIGLAFRPSWRLYMLASLVRYAELLIWTLRYWLAFRLLGLPISPEAALTMACISSVATMIPIFSNGLGIREWTIGLASPLLTEHVLEIGLTADLVNRATELVVATICGLAALGLLNRSQYRRQRTQAFARNNNTKKNHAQSDDEQPRNRD